MSLGTIASMRAPAQESAIPLRQYFLAVGGVLLGLLIATDWLLPRPAQGLSHGYDHPVVRIHSDVKGPEAVVIDGAAPQPTKPAQPRILAAHQAPVLPIVPADGASVEPPTVSESVENDGVPLSAPASAIGNSYAQLGPEFRGKARNKTYRAAPGVRKRPRAQHQPAISIAQERRRIP